jgi:predicted dehydrogenase
VKRLRIGLLGAATIAPKAVVAPAAEVGVDVVAVAARDERRAEDFARAHGIERVHRDCRALVDAPDIDAVYIALPIALHAEWALAALRAGKHVLCEKAIASNAGEAADMVAAAAQSGRHLVEAFHGGTGRWPTGCSSWRQTADRCTGQSRDSTRRSLPATSGTTSIWLVAR